MGNLNNMDFSIVIVNYNTKKFLRKCLKSLPANTEVIVVDNNSSDGSSQMIKKEFVKVKLIENKRNLGFAKAVNQALRQARGKYVLLLNPDTEVIGNALEKIVEFARKHPEVGVVGGRLIDPDGTIQGSCFHQLTILNAIKEFWLRQKGVFQKYAPKTKKPVEVEAVVGACMLIPKKVIDKVGLFDERYFLYFEDLDFCRRVRGMDLKIYYLPKAEFIHYHGASGKEIPRQTRQWLIQSSKIYNGPLKHYLMNFIILIGQK